MELLDESARGFIHNLCGKSENNNQIPPEYYDLYSVKRGLRNADGTGVVAGITKVCNVHGYLISEGERIPHDGELTYRGYNVESLVKGYQAENRFGYEETAFLLLFGFLPTRAELDAFTGMLESLSELPDGFCGGHRHESAQPRLDEQTRGRRTGARELQRQSGQPGRRPGHGPEHGS